MSSLKRRSPGNVPKAVYHLLLKEAPHFLYDPSYIWIVGILLWNIEIFINLLVIFKVKYTEIDWKAYMDEVEGFLNGTHDYMKLEGGTGPLVYPAGFVYVYSVLYHATNHGQDIRFAQYIFFLFYLVNLFLVFRIYHRTQKCPPFILVFLCCTSYRVHSLFVLRLFNDPVAMMIFYLALNFFIDNNWYVGSFCFSLAVSIKMNILLFAPGLLVLLLVGNGLYKTAMNLILCLILQILLGLPFLLENPWGYIICSFDLSRQFFHVWTVNWRFLPEKLFLDRRLHVTLLLFHILLLLAFAAKKWKRNFTDLFNLLNLKRKWTNGKLDLLPNQIVLVLFTSNFIGICFSRSLHYQFYIWYYHTLPYLLWSTSYSTPVRLLIFGLIELSWNTYPSTNASSICLHLCHVLLLYGLWRNNEILLEIPERNQSSKKRN